METAAPFVYDYLPYDSQPFVVTHPDHLSVIATLRGLQPAAAEYCRILELGCGTGNNIIPMAHALPNATVVGIDLSEEQVRSGRAMIDQVGLKNITLLKADIAEYAPPPGSFDYIICHGVYSWVPEPVRDKVLKLCRSALSENGLAYISYNVLPGWSLRGMIRDVMKYHTRKLDDPAKIAPQARAICQFLAEASQCRHAPNLELLKLEYLTAYNLPDWYVLHDYLEEINRPLYFHQFAEQIAGAGLQYVGESEVSMMIPQEFDTEVRQALYRIGKDTIELEQYMDFLRLRMFRGSIICQSERTIDRKVDFGKLKAHYFAASLKCEASSEHLVDNSVVQFTHANGGAIQTPDPVLKIALAIMAEEWPGSASYRDLVETIHGALFPGQPLIEQTVMGIENLLTPMLLKTFFAGHLEMRLTPHRFSVLPPERPRSSVLARRNVERGENPINLKHERIELTREQKTMLMILDGSVAKTGLDTTVLNELCRKALIEQE